MDYSEYHPDWRDIIRPAILKRDQYKCKHCSIRHKSRVYNNSRRQYVECDQFIEEWAKNNGYKVFTVYLQVAHIDHDKSNNDYSNLISLCPKCHGKFDRAHKAFMRKVATAKANKSKSNKITAKSAESFAGLSVLRSFINSCTGYTLNEKQLNKIVSICKNIKENEHK